MYLVKTPRIIKSLFKQKLIWDIPVTDKTVFLTFDDGPTPDVTEFVLDTLKSYNAKGTFFCLGKNVEAHPDIFERIKAEGHAVGNHSYSHLNGRQTENQAYFEDIEKCKQVIDSMLFRPPYGKLTLSQYAILNTQYAIIMWDVLSGDFDTEIEPEQCYQNVINNVKPGSIIVFHDSLKAEKNLRYALPKALEKMTTEDYQFESIKLTSLQSSPRNHAT